MKTAVIYYSFTGNTAKIAKQTAATAGAALIEIKPAREPGESGSYMRGRERY